MMKSLSIKYIIQIRGGNLAQKANGIIVNGFHIKVKHQVNAQHHGKIRS